MKNESPRSLLAALQQHFPDPGSPTGDPGPEPQWFADAAAFKADLDAIALRLRRKISVITGVVLTWFAVLLVVALLAENAYASLVALGTAGGGTLWCVNILLRLSKELFYAEVLVAAAARDEASFLSQLVELCREQLRTPQRVDEQAPPLPGTAPGPGTRRAPKRAAVAGSAASAGTRATARRAR